MKDLMGDHDKGSHKGSSNKHHQQISPNLELNTKNKITPKIQKKDKLRIQLIQTTTCSPAATPCSVVAKTTCFKR
jgi:hypothetical protein